jgi:hypothetical protein
MAQQCQLAGIAIDLELGRADLLAQNGGAVADWFELHGIEIERRRRGDGYGLDLDVTHAAIGKARRKPQSERCTPQATGEHR